jgi:LysM repeat protein
LLAAALLIVSAQLAYGNSPARYDQIVVGEGDSLWSIAQAHYQGDPRPRVDQIMRINHLASPTLIPGEALRIPVN